MKSKHFTRVIVLGSLVLVCLLVVQVYWFKKAFDVAEKQFDHSVQVALKKVADSVSHDPQVKKLSSNFFFVVTESELDNLTLDSLLKKEFLLRSLAIDYELGVYNAEDDTLVYGNYVQATRRPWLQQEAAPETRASGEKNFVVYFPKKESYLAAQLDVWIFSTIILLLMMGFFAYAIASLLRERKFAALKNDFINNMTHEFKTPVTNINIAGEILKQKMAGQPGTHVYIDILLKENEKLRQKIDQVLLGASADQLTRPTLERVDVHALIVKCAETFQFKVQERQGDLQLSLLAQHTSVMADQEMLAQAISNVIDNAEKYSPQSPRIVVHTEDHGDAISISIVDRGIGIAPDMKNKVFEKFFRVPSGDVHTIKGFGLGLNFVKSVVRSHRGKVSLVSELNKGTEIRILLPVVA